MLRLKQCRFCGCSFEGPVHGSSYCMPAHAKADKTGVVEIEPVAVLPPAIAYKPKEPTRLDKVKQGRRYRYSLHKAEVDAELAWRKLAKEKELYLAAKYKNPNRPLIHSL